ncbi:hypothetical protein AN958_03215 [Leucoagaricus sp. SymC.cos]|nr:hypothetical protein AN958_03215 [Leucoagaricus sp. SymC.cos]
MPALFQPARASPPPRLARANHVPATPPSIDLSVISSSTVVVPELRNLTLDDFDVIEAVIQRAGPLTTTFPIVFKAYNGVLKERGMDAGEVKYYGKLLKLGTMKGKNWGEKWEAVKRQHPQEGSSKNDHDSASSRVKSRSQLTPTVSHPKIPLLQDIDAETMPSDTDEDDGLANATQRHRTSNLFPKKMQSKAPKPSAEHNSYSKISMISSLRGLPMSVLNRHSISDTSLFEAETISPGKAASSERSTSKGAHHPQNTRSCTPVSAKHLGNFRPISNGRFSNVRRGRGQETADEDDAWNKIRMQQLEAEADRFRGERLSERCWEVWKESHQWIMTSHEQIDQARNVFLLRLAFHHWRNTLASRKAIYQDVAVLDNERRLCAFLTLWRRRLREKQQTRWRADMRNKLKMIKDHQNARLLEEAWSLWTQKYQLAFADQQYATKLLLVVFLKWKELFNRVDKIEGTAEHLAALKDSKMLLRCWQAWQTTTVISKAEKEMNTRVQARIMWQAYSLWRKRAYDFHKGAFCRDRNLQRRFLSRWQLAVQKVHALETRADKHSARRDKILACAVLRVWLAHVRGREVDRQRDKKVLYLAFSTWKKKIVTNRYQEDLAARFHEKTSTRVTSTALSRWHTVYMSCQTACNTAIAFRENHLVKMFGFVWLSRFQEGVENRKRLKLVKKLQNRQAARVLYRWLLLIRKRRHCAQVETLVQEKVHQHIGRNALSYWTERVIFMRERELNAMEIYSAKLERQAQTYTHNYHCVLTATRGFWLRLKSVHIHHKENLKLLEDHLAFKQEDILRRCFHRWLAATRVTQHRRYILQNKEDETKQVILQKVWDKWKSNYLERRLRPLEIEMLMRSQQNLMYQAFSVWHAKARTRPAIVAVKFNAEHTKRKFYVKWQEALPIAQKARKVKEKHDNLILSRVFKQWLEAYRTKLVLKAVALVLNQQISQYIQSSFRRARYLRLPTTGARAINGPPPITSFPSSSGSPPHESTPISSTNLYPVRSGASYTLRRSPTQGPSNEEPIVDDSEAVDNTNPTPTGERPRRSRLSRSPFGLGQGTGIVSLLRTNIHQNQQGKSDLSPPRSRYQFPNLKARRGSSVNGADSRDMGGSSLFASVNAESTPPSRRPRSTTSDNLGGRLTQWNRFGTGRRVRQPSPSVTSQSTESPPSLP